MNSRLLTYETLLERRACEDHREAFQRIFGNQVEVSVERFSQPDVIEASFDYDWAADLLLSDETRLAYYKEHRKQREALKKEYDVGYYSHIPREVSDALEAKLWAEYYVKDAPEQPGEPAVEQPAVVEGEADGN